jgi:AraC-like DNA-binding protein
MLGYLAAELGVSERQVARYCDYGWVPNAYKTRGGQRRIRYTDATVEQVRTTALAAKKRNQEIRYRTTEIRYGTLVINARPCNCMDDVYRAAKRTGLSNKQAINLAYCRRVQDGRSADNVAWEALWMVEGTTEAEAFESTKIIDLLPLPTLLATSDPGEFRHKAEQAWTKIERDLCAASAGDRATVRHLLNQPDRKAFVRECDKAMELENRITNRNDEELHSASRWARDNPNQAELQLAALRMKMSQRKATVSALAETMHVSRLTLYRRFGKGEIRAALRAITYDHLAATEQRNDRWAKGKKDRQNRSLTL